MQKLYYFIIITLPVLQTSRAWTPLNYKILGTTCDDTVSSTCWSYKISYHSITGKPLLYCLCVYMCVLWCVNVSLLYTNECYQWLTIFTQGAESACLGKLWTQIPIYTIYCPCLCASTLMHTIADRYWSCISCYITQGQHEIKTICDHFHCALHIEKKAWFALPS